MNHNISEISQRKSKGKKTTKGKNFTLGIKNIEYPKTLFETGDEVVVMEAVQNLVKEHVDHSGGSVGCKINLDTSQFTDPDFTASLDSIYLQNDLSQDEK